MIIFEKKLTKNSEIYKWILELRDELKAWTMNVSSLGCFFWPQDHKHWFAEMWNIGIAIA